MAVSYWPEIGSINIEFLVMKIALLGFILVISETLQEILWAYNWKTLSFIIGLTKIFEIKFNWKIFILFDSSFRPHHCIENFQMRCWRYQSAFFTTLSDQNYMWHFFYQIDTKNRNRIAHFCCGKTLQFLTMHISEFQISMYCLSCYFVPFLIFYQFAWTIWICFQAFLK